MVSLSTITLRAAIACSILLRAAEAGYAPKEKPKLPAGFCPKGTGTVTDTTGGECRARIVARPFPLRDVMYDQIALSAQRRLSDSISFFLAVLIAP
jgi:hypothetical protein